MVSRISAAVHKFIHWRPFYQPLTIAVVACYLGFAIGLGLLLAAAFLDMPSWMAMTATLLGVVATPPLGLLSVRYVEFSLYAWKVRRCLTDGNAEYLMPGAFTHVVVHRNLPGEVILIKRGDEAMSRYVGRLGPRHTNASEWQMYRTLRDLNVAVPTKFLMLLRISRIRMRFGSKLVDQAVVKGEERFVADQHIRERVEIYTQERGITLSEFLAENGEERRRVAEQLAQLIRRMWKNRIVDLDVAMRNYLIRLNDKGRPIHKKKRYDIRCHDYGCIFHLDSHEGPTVMRFLTEYGEVGELGKAVLDNSACLARSLSGRKERLVAESLVPQAAWPQLRTLFDPKSDSMPIARRLRHHTNNNLLKHTKKAMAIAMIKASRGPDSGVAEPTEKSTASRSRTAKPRDNKKQASGSST